MNIFGCWAWSKYTVTSDNGIKWALLNIASLEYISSGGSAPSFQYLSLVRKMGTKFLAGPVVVGQGVMTFNWSRYYNKCFTRGSGAAQD